MRNRLGSRTLRYWIDKTNDDALQLVVIDELLRDLELIREEAVNHPQARYLYVALKKSKSRIERGEPIRPFTPAERAEMKRRARFR